MSVKDHYTYLCLLHTLIICWLLIIIYIYTYLNDVFVTLINNPLLLALKNMFHTLIMC